MVSLTIFCLLSCVVSGAVTQSISSLSTSLKALEASLDQNNDGQVTKAERDFDLQNNFDTNRDGCVDALEWSTRLTSLNFTKELASYILTLARSTNISRPAGCDGISVYYGQPGTTEGLVSSYIYTLTRMCEGDTTLYLTNSDCR
ncbi:uncharacterized protein LOC101854393 [Aplysia californica]|uniref:Uncharacterized protein LOC101854393 n=1 Tax=Aplysia californica TaxID=6500 RepID=A0ABM0ZUG5_APLCA|nr:uncharacterized protein LOC101854393 [Aplysia californica]